MKRKLMCIGFCTILLGLTGCYAGTAAELLTFDNVIGAAMEAKKGIVAYDTAVKTSDAKRQAAMLKILGTDVKNIAIAEKMTPKDAEILAGKVVVSMTTHFANYLEQERRRDALYRVTMDNLNYIIDISNQGKEFSVYRADVSAQWKSYLQASLRRQLTKSYDTPLVERPSND